MKMLIWKDYKVCLRTMGGLILLITLIGNIPILIITLDGLKSISDNNMISSSLRTCIMFFPAVQIPMIGTLAFQASLNEERKNRVLQVLFADGIKPESVWASKMITSITMSYGLSLVSIFISVVFAKAAYNIWIPFDIESIIMILIIVPIVGFAFLSLIGTLMWSCKQGQFIAGFMPMFSYIGIMYLNMYLVEHNKTIDFMLILPLAVLSFIIFFLNMLIVKKLKKEYIVNMQI